MTDVFGKVHLGYLVIETEKFDDWRRFGRDAIGMHLDETLPDTVRFRLDDNECRFLLQRGPAEDTTALGWQVDDHGAFEVIEKRVRSHGVPVTAGIKGCLPFGFTCLEGLLLCQQQSFERRWIVGQLLGEDGYAHADGAVRTRGSGTLRHAVIIPDQAT